MTDDAATTVISAVGTAFVPVSDQDRVLEFFIGKLGFEKRADFAYGGEHRWVEVAPPGSANAIALVPASEGASARRRRDPLCAHRPTSRPPTRCCWVKASMSTQRSRAPARSRSGLVSTVVSVDDPFPPQFFVRDPDGNRFLVVDVG